MFERVSQYDVMSRLGRWYRPRAYATLRPDGHWEGWLVFFPLDRGQPVASGPETIQFTRSDVVLWAAGLGSLYLDGALERALALVEPPATLAHLDIDEYEALEDAEQLETAAAVERAEAEVDEAAAEVAREEAARIHQDRMRTGILGTAEEVAATREVAIHKEAARRADNATAESTRTPMTARTRRGTRTNRKKAR